MDPTLHVDAVAKAYGSIHALRGVTFSIDPGQIVGLVGRNGAGKTTLASVIAGLRRPDQGSVEICGLDVVTRTTECGRLRGYAAQEVALYPSLTVRQNLLFFAELSLVHRGKLGERVELAARALGLQGLLSRRVATLSGGQQRRLHVAVALIHEPALLILDEPTAGIDIESRDLLLDALESAKNQGMAILYSTHYLTEVERLDAYVLVLDRGEVVERGAVRQLVARHGVSYIDLRFRGHTPSVVGWPTSEPERGLLRLSVSEIETDLPKILAALESNVSRLEAVELVHSSMDSAFVKITGARIEEAVPA